MNTEDMSVNPAVQQMAEKAKRDDVETVWDRYEQQQPQCGFGELGICCRNCLQGPCRINPFGEPSHGICGISADGIVARNFLRFSAGGAATHADHAFETVEMLSKTAEGSVPYEIADPAKLKAVAAKLGVPTRGKSVKRLAADVAKVAFEDFAPGKETMRWLTANAPEERVNVWREAGILPKDPDLEIRRVMHQTSMGVDADYTNMVLAAMKMGLVDAYSGLQLGCDVQDIVFGTPKPVKTQANLGVLDEDKVNIIVHGHVPFLSEKIVEWARKLEGEAKKAGAKGIKIAGMCCTGNEVLMRKGIPSAGNFLAQEFAIITGAVDLMVVDVQCVMPSLAQVASCYHTKLVTTHEIGKIPGAEHMPFNAETADEDAQRIVRMGIEAYKKRNLSRVEIPDIRQEMWGGFSVEAIEEIFGCLNSDKSENPLKPLVDAITSGQITGVAAVLGCNNTRFKHDSMITRIAERLLQENILVLTGGCAAHSLGNTGMMCPEGTEKYAGESLRKVLEAAGQAAGLGAAVPPVLHIGSCVDNSRVGALLTNLAAAANLDIKDLPVAASAPELAHEKSVAIGNWCVALGVFTHIGMAPFVGGGREVTRMLTSEMEKLVGGKYYVEPDPDKAADTIIAHIKAKRSALGI